MSSDGDGGLKSVTRSSFLGGSCVIIRQTCRSYSPQSKSLFGIMLCHAPTPSSLVGSGFGSLVAGSRGLLLPYLSSIRRSNSSSSTTGESSNSLRQMSSTSSAESGFVVNSGQMSMYSGLRGSYSIYSSSEPEGHKSSSSTSIVRSTTSGCFGTESTCIFVVKL